MTQFYRLWNKIEQSYRDDIRCSVSDGKYSRSLVLSERGGRKTAGEIDVGRVIAAYIDAFDRALKAFFYYLETPSKGISEAEEIYRRYLIENPVLI